MERFVRLTACAAPLSEADVDTDIIFPARFLLHTEKRGLGQFAFYERRFDGDGAERGDIFLNQGAYDEARILVAGENFGCGSSREQAVWALADLGLRCVIAPSFGEIFYSNMFKNGLLPVRLDAAKVARLMADAEEGAELTIDLEAEVVVRPNGERLAFSTPAWRRDALLNGWDDIDLVLQAHAADITTFEARQRAQRPWLYTQE
jgi:3-isopropylmalate/(R)-2-methylmalate dehydratase small subunit